LIEDSVSKRSGEAIEFKYFIYAFGTKFSNNPAPVGAPLPLEGNEASPKMMNIMGEKRSK
jgi:hypothetical protein